MRVPLYASEPESLAKRVEAHLDAAGVACDLSPARRPVDAVWDLAPGPVDVRVEHSDLSTAEAALSGFEPPPVAGRPAAGGSVVLRLIEAQPGWTDFLAAGPTNTLRLVRRVPITDRSQRDAWERRIRSVLWQATDNLKRSLEGWRDRTALTPAVVSCAPSEQEPALELVLELTTGGARRLPSVWEAGPLEPAKVVRAYRTLIEAAPMATGRGLGLNGLHPEGFLLRDDYGLIWGDVGLQRLLGLTHSEADRPRHPLSLPRGAWDRDPADAFRLESLRLIKSLLCGDADAPLPGSLAPLAELFGWAERAHPETEALEERWQQALRALGTCGRCGSRLSAAACPSCR